MPSILKSTSLCLLATAPLLVSAVQLPTTIQLDIAFPRNNTVYKPFHPFPFVFVLNNDTAITSSSFLVGWTLANAELPSEIIARYDVTPGSSIPRPEEDTPALLMIDPIHELSNTTATKFSLRVTFGIASSCNEDGQLLNSSVTVENTLFFSFDAENGIEPDVMAGGSCPNSIGAVRIQKEIQELGKPRKCLVMDDSPQDTQECSFKVTESIAKDVAARLSVARDGCEGQAWSDVSLLRGKCDPKTSDCVRVLAWKGNVVISALLMVGSALVGI